jgi:hypothetical protein
MKDIAALEFHDDRSNDSAVHDEICDKSNSHRSSYTRACNDTFRIPKAAYSLFGFETK